MKTTQSYTIYDVLEKKGIFAANPANIGSFDLETHEPLYKGPVEFPKMLYHPKGERRMISRGEMIETPMGAKVVGEQWELISQIVNSAEEEAKLLAEGWHHKPWQAMKAAGVDVTAMEAAAARAPQSENDKDARIRVLEAKLAEMQAAADAPIIQSISEDTDVLREKGLID